MIMQIVAFISGLVRGDANWRPAGAFTEGKRQFMLEGGSVGMAGALFSLAGKVAVWV